MKKLISIFLVLIMIVVALPATSFAKNNQFKTFNSKKEQILQSIKKQLELQNREDHYPLYKKLIDKEYKNRYNSKAMARLSSSDSFKVYAEDGGYVGYKSSYWNQTVKYDRIYLDKKATSKLLSGNENTRYLTWAAWAVGGLGGIAAKACKKALFKTAGYIAQQVGAASGSALTMYDILKFMTTDQIGDRAEMIRVETDGGRESVSVVTWHDYPYIDVPHEENGYSDVEYGTN